jgi:hypothetical protein
MAGMLALWWLYALAFFAPPLWGDFSGLEHKKDKGIKGRIF